MSLIIEDMLESEGFCVRRWLRGWFVGTRTKVRE